MGEAVPVRFGQIGHEQFHVMVGHGVRIAFQGHVVAVKHQNGRFAAVCDSVDSRHRQSGVLQAENRSRNGGGWRRRRNGHGAWRAPVSLTHWP